ncbi:GH36-type glycosyl hydrolase domain-containing protein, partial [Erwinia oleae]|uniref:GH36-type glycosyl hydrolase domain-containing protein n=1 Tax=Erwinia oleae TaxID=796334 RepID=UPI00054F71B2
LVMPVYPDTLLEKMALSAVEQQIASGNAAKTPWGVSESGYASFDAAHNYQYKAFGTPELGLKRDLNNDQVIAPYATLLALMVLPHPAIENLIRLKKMGAKGEYGFFEALDFTARRLAQGQQFVPVRSYMAHHQGMGFLAIAHLLLNAPMVERFMSSALFQSSRLLLQERLPDDIELYTPRRQFADATDNKQQHSTPDQRELNGADARLPQLQLLSNANYHLMITQSGAGYSQWKGLALTRWRADGTSNNHGTFCYIRDRHSGEVISHSFQPRCRTRPYYKARFNDAGIEFDAHDGVLSTHTHIVVSPEDDVEIRRITVTNRSRQSRQFDITSYAEVVLAPASSDMAHTAFSKLFVQTEIVSDLEAILAHRRPREEKEETPWMFHAMAIHGTIERETTYETDRAQFLGRGNTPANPQALTPEGELTGCAGSVLDPVLSIRQSVHLKPGGSVTIDMLYGVTMQRETSVALIEKYRNHISADRVFELAWSYSQVALRQLNIEAEDASLFNRLASAVLFPCPEMRGEMKNLLHNRLGQDALWRHSLSGDLPIVLVRINNNSQLELVTSLIQAHQYWRQKGLTVDLVIMNGDQGGYQQSLHNQILGLIASGEERLQADKPGGIFIRKSENFSPDDLQLLLSVAVVVLEGQNGSLLDQLSVVLKPARIFPAAQFLPASEKLKPPVTLPAADALRFFNGTGGFSEDGSEYHILLPEGHQTPAPWSNVLANSQFGTVISESGQAYSWYENAHEYRLTPWQNDPVSDTSGEALYLRDETSGVAWSPMPLPLRGEGDYLTRHGFGYSCFEHQEHGISSTLTVFVAQDAPVKLSLLTLSNRSGRTRHLSVTGYVEWVLGELASQSARHVVTSSALLATGSAVLAQNFYSGAGSTRTAFFAVTGNQVAYSGNRLECLGRNGTAHRPAMMSTRGLSGTTGGGLDPCAALQTLTTLIDGDSCTLVFALGVGEDEASSLALMERFLSAERAESELENVRHSWRDVLNRVRVQTPDPAVDLLANGWLLYQTLASRLLARSGYYQSGGAFGFRDQLQDTLALVHAAPERLRDQLLLCASRQFIEGDVQHWWHPPSGRGVRTRCSDDYLWLPYALCRYVTATGDRAVLSQSVPYLEARLPGADEESVYEQPHISQTRETLWQHAVRAIKHGLRYGEHGLPLMGSGDWNDGMSTVGIAGKGESVWLGFFLYTVLTRFAALAVEREDGETATLCQQHAENLKIALNQKAWDGEWFLRGFYDSGETLGSHANAECRIDAIAQSWAVLSGAGDPDKCESALNALYQQLVDSDNGLIKLLTPPFDGAGPNPGYIRGYLPGIRENGGQYTHGALWAIMAFAERGQTDRAWSLLSLINPINHSLTAAGTRTYKVEPYVMAADVYAAEGHVGRGGWTWYTGSAGWTWQLVIEHLLGITRHGEYLSVRPRLPADWPAVTVIYREGNGTYHINVTRTSGVGQLWLDGVLCENEAIPLSKDNLEHQVIVHLPDEEAP